MRSDFFYNPILKCHLSDYAATPYIGTGNPSVVTGSTVPNGAVTASSSVERSVPIEQTALESQEASPGPDGKGLKEKRKFSEIRSSNLDQDFMLDEQFTFQLQDRWDRFGWNCYPYFISF